MKVFCKVKDCESIIKIYKMIRYRLDNALKSYNIQFNFDVIQKLQQQ